MLKGRVRAVMLAVYKWQASMIKIWKRIMRFIWSVNGEIRQTFVISWPKVRCPTQEGGLGIQRLECIYKTKTLLKKLPRRILDNMSIGNVLNGKV